MEDRAQAGIKYFTDAVMEEIASVNLIRSYVEFRIGCGKMATGYFRIFKPIPEFQNQKLKFISG